MRSFDITPKKLLPAMFRDFGPIEFDRHTQARNPETSGAFHTARSVRFGLRILLVWVLGLSAAGPIWGVAYYNITSVKCEQLNNAIRIKIEADGAITANVDDWYGAGYYLDFAEVEKQMTGEWDPICYPRVDKIYVHLVNARPKCGSVAHIGKYPVSYVSLVMTTEAGAELGVDITVALNRLMRFRRFKLSNMDTWDAYMYDHHDPAWFEVVLSNDKRSLLITVMSDQLPEVRDHLSAGNVPEKDRELNVTTDGGLLNVHARNARLADLVEAVGKASGRQMAVEQTTDRVVTAELPAITAEEFAERLSRAYGLVLNGTDERWVFSDIIAQTETAYMSGSAEEIPVHNMKAGQARGLLPTFLLDYARVDEGRNTLVVSGSKALVEKVRV